MTSAMKVERDGAIAWIILDNPKKLNAMTIAAWQELGEHVRALNADLAVRCAIVAGEGRAFLAGHDIAEINEHCDDIQSGKVGRDAAARMAEGAAGDDPADPIGALPLHRRRPGLCGRCRLRTGLRLRSRGGRGGRPVRLSGGQYRGHDHQWRHLLPAAARSASPRPASLPIRANSSPPRRPTGSGSSTGWCRLTAQGGGAAAWRSASPAARPLAVQLHKVMLDRGLEASLETMLHFETECMIHANLSQRLHRGHPAWLERRTPNFTGS